MHESDSSEERLLNAFNVRPGAHDEKREDELFVSIVPTNFPFECVANGSSVVDVARDTRPNADKAVALHLRRVAATTEGDALDQPARGFERLSWRIPRRLVQSRSDRFTVEPTKSLVDRSQHLAAAGLFTPTLGELHVEKEPPIRQGVDHVDDGGIQSRVRAGDVDEGRDCLQIEASSLAI